DAVYSYKPRDVTWRYPGRSMAQRLRSHPCRLTKSVAVIILSPGRFQGESKMDNTNRRSGRGFASMDPARRREIASLGGRAAHASGNAHEFTSEEAQAAGARSHLGRQRQQQQQQGNKAQQ